MWHSKPMTCISRTFIVSLPCGHNLQMSSYFQLCSRSIVNFILYNQSLTHSTKILQAVIRTGLVIGPKFRNQNIHFSNPGWPKAITSLRSMHINCQLYVQPNKKLYDRKIQSILKPNAALYIPQPPLAITPLLLGKRTRPIFQPGIA